MKIVGTSWADLLYPAILIDPTAQAPSPKAPPAPLKVRWAFLALYSISDDLPMRIKTHRPPPPPSCQHSRYAYACTVTLEYPT